MKSSESLKKLYEERRERAEKRFPGIIVAGPANYPINQHKKAWDLVDKARNAYLSQKEKEERAKEFSLKKDNLKKDIDAAMERVKNPLINTKVGDKLMLFWTNSGKQYKAIAEAVKINARTIKIKLVDEIPTGYSIGQSWAVEKIGTAYNYLEPLSNA